MKVYIASPLFTPPQNAMLDRLEDALTDLGYTFFSPRQDGGDLSKMTPDERAAAARQIFISNVRELNSCDVYLINIDDRDVGTAWEFGYGYGIQQRVVSGELSRDHDKVLITFSSNGFGLNIMLNDSSEYHFPTLDGLLGMLATAATEIETNSDDRDSRDLLRQIAKSFSQDLKSNSDVH